jgi:hypothetical protein
LASCLSSVYPPTSRARADPPGQPAPDRFPEGGWR